MLVGTWAARYLKADPVWQAAQQNAAIRGSKNPIFTGALGEYDGVVLYEYERIMNTKTGASSANVVHNLLLGQQAAKQPDLPLRILGPTPGSIEKISDTYRYKLTVKCRNDRRFRDLVRSTLALYEKEKLPSKASVVVDLHSDGDI